VTRPLAESSSFCDTI